MQRWYQLGYTSAVSVIYLHLENDGSGEGKLFSFFGSGRRLTVIKQARTFEREYPPPVGDSAKIFNRREGKTLCFAKTDAFQLG